MMTAGLATLCACLGLVLGWLHFAGLEENVRLYLEPHASRRGIALHLLRIGITALGLTWLARACGARGLVAALLGFSLARVLILWRVSRTA